jgi:hypothetical protein
MTIFDFFIKKELLINHFELEKPIPFVSQRIKTDKF